MPIRTMALGAIVQGWPLPYSDRVNLWQGWQMASRQELSARAALCRQLAKREPTNRVLWTAEADNWSRLSDEKLRGEQKPPHENPCPRAGGTDRASRCGP